MSSIFSTGINIKNIHMIIFASGGKAFIRLVQSIGRGLRKHHSKEKLIIIDLADQLHYGISHLNKRLEIYKRENIPFNISTIKEP
jgi:predicted helicase